MFQLPGSEAEWLAIERKFEEKPNFPHCLGSIDGKHVVFQATFNSGSDYYNYKGTFSIVLLAVVDSDYKFIFANVGCQGRISDGGVFKNTSFYKKLVNNELNLPSDMPLLEQRIPMPYVFVADDAFPLLKNILKTYSGYQLKGSVERVFKCRVSRARIVVENVFGILSSVFRVLRKPMLLQEDKATSVVLACVYLHNFLRRNSDAQSIYTPPGSFDSFDADTGDLIPGEWRKEGLPKNSLLPIQRKGRKTPSNAKDIRNELASYFSTASGQISTQSKFR